MPGRDKWVLWGRAVYGSGQAGPREGLREMKQAVHGHRQAPPAFSLLRCGGTIARCGVVWCASSGAWAFAGLALDCLMLTTALSGTHD